MAEYLRPLLITLIVTSCTVIKTDNPKTEVKYYFGIPFVTFPTNDGVQYNDVESIGLGVNNQGIHLGYFQKKQYIQTEPNSCSVIILVENKDEINNIIQSLESAEVNIDELCIFKE